MRSRWAGDCGGLRVVGGPARVGWRLREIVFCGCPGVQPPRKTGTSRRRLTLLVFSFTPATALAFQLRRHPRLAQCSTHSPSSPLRSPLPAASISAALAATCVCATLRTRSARAARRRVAVRAPAHAPVGHRAHVGRARAVGVDRRHPVGHAHRDFPRRHARHGAHGRDWHAHGAVLAAARAAQGLPPALPCPARSPATPPARRDVAEVRLLEEPSPQTRVGLPRQPCRHRTVRGDRRQGVCLVGEGPTYRASRRGARIG